jgi:putative serine protease PepD
MPPPAYMPQPRPAWGRGRFAAVVVAASLVAGGGAGLGGAAAWDALQDEPTATTTTTTHQATTSTVASTSDSTAPEGSVEAVAGKVLPSVVKIDVVGQQGAGSGSGIILSSDGQILTNNHVVEVAQGGGSLSVSFDDGSSADATVLGTDPLTDTALIQAQDVSGLTPATIGRSGDLDVGQGVVAIGSPFGLESTVTSGIVSALDRPVDVGSDGQGNATVYPAIQTDAAINPGNSGGPLVDLAGNVVGINSSIRTAASGGESGSIGLGFAIPIDEVMPIVGQMAKGEEPTHARMGVSVSDVAARAGAAGTTSAELAEGARIEEVISGSTADDAGIRAGDVVTKVDAHRITSTDSLIATIRSYRPGDTVTVTYVRDGDERTAELALDSDADTTSS